MHIGTAAAPAASAAGAPLSQSAGPTAERAAADATAERRAADADNQAADAAGIGHTEEDQHASDRDADGRRLWERNEPEDRQSAEESQTAKCDDPSGERGNELDLVG